MTTPTPLLVPMPVQALLVNALVQKDPTHQFLRWNTNYDNLNAFLDPVPAPFTNIEQQPVALGVHLHWKLPSALARGHGQDTQHVEFPYTPNRWIVVRISTTAGATAAPSMKAWVIQSDYLAQDGSSAFADPFTSVTNNVRTTKLGRSVAIEEWTSEPGGQLFLRATGLADVTFTAFQPGVRDVFSFHDDTTKLPENTLLTYLVAGWYSDPARDPLATFTPDQLDWQVLGKATDAPTLTIAHGLIYGLNWQTTSVPPRIDGDAKQMQIGVGSTSVDALAAILAAQAGDAGGELETKLEAFNYDMLSRLDEPDGMAQLELRIRRAWFGSTPGGTRWDIVAVSQGQTTDDRIDRGTTPPPPVLTDAQARWLADLNVSQRTLDADRRELTTAQWELFALWWKSQRLPFILNDPAQVAQQQGWGVDLTVIQGWIQQALDATNNESVLKGVQDLQDAVNTQGANLPDPTSPDSISKWSAKIPPSPPGPDTPPLSLRPVALPSFSQPADPVLLIAGLTPPTNDVDESVALPCRRLDAAANGVTVAGTPITATSGSLASIIPIPSNKAFPAPVAAAVAALAIETFFADPNNAASILENGAGKTDPATLEALTAAMTARAAQVSSIPQPLQASFAFAAWQQAWSPLYLQWQIDWFPTVAASPSGPMVPPPEAQYPPNSGGGQDNWAFSPDGWQFDGSDDVTARGAEYYRWTDGDPWSAATNPVGRASYVGRTFLTPQATLLLIRRLEDYVRLHPEDPDLDRIKDLIQKVGETRFLSQSLSGFNAAFLMRGLTHSSAPSPATAVGQAVAGENRGVPMVEQGDQDFDFSAGSPFFFPVRGGYFQFQRLHLVDAFGQVLDLLYANGNIDGTPETFLPIRGAGLVPEPDSGIASPARRVRQVPRLVQPARLDLRLLDATDDSREIFYAPHTNPVCGWLLPNHLDRSIAAYDAAGAALGELLVLVDEDGNQNVQWLPAPGDAKPVEDPSEISNAHLRDMLSAFTIGDGGIPAAGRVAAFRALYQSIDETLWMIDPPGGEGDGDLAVLIGRPLAVVRAQLQLELSGRPAVNQSWRDTLQDVNAGLTTFTFPIRLGSTELLDDGLIGYFVADRYTTFDAVHASAKATSPYVAPIAPGNYLALPFDYPAYSTITLTLLLDPRASVHATTGILPTASLTLPVQFYADALSRMAVTFRTGPILSQTSPIRVPFPAERHGTWAWVRHTGTGATDWDAEAIVAANTQPRLADSPPHLLDGWLRFTPRSDK